MIVNSANGENLRDMRSCLADFGKIVDVGCVDVNDYGRLEMSSFQRSSATFSSFDLGNIIQRNSKLTSTLVDELGKLYKARKIKPISVFPVAAIGKVYKELLKPDRMGNFILCYETQNQELMVMHSSLIRLIFLTSVDFIET